MSTSHLRLVVVGTSLILAVLTGLLTGLIGAGSDCVASPTPVDGASAEPTAGQPTAEPPPAAPSAPGPYTPQPSGDPGGRRNGVGDAVPSDPGGGNGGDRTDGADRADSAGSAERPGSTDKTAGLGSTGLAALAADACDSGGAFSVGAAVAGFLGALLAGLVAGGVALISPRRGAAPDRGTPIAPATGSAPVRRAEAPAAEPVGVVAATDGRVSGGARDDADGRRARDDRALLVSTCIYVRDRATSKAIADRLAWALNEVGVAELRPAGQTFDAARHEAGGAAPTDDPRLVGTIAAVELAGYADRGAVVRAPVVTVYRSATR
jgi:hypothetical protein